MPDTQELEQRTGQVLLSRRQILTGTSIGIGATLLFHTAARNRVDVPTTTPPAGPARTGAATTDRRSAGAGGAADGASRDGRTRSSQDGQSAAQGVEGPGEDDLVAQVEPVEPVEPAPDGAIHRARLSQEGSPRSVCKGDGGVLVVGMSAGGDPLGWLTDDGSAWLEHTLGSVDDDQAEVWGVTAYDGEFVAVGSTIEREVRRIAASGIVAGGDPQVTYVEKRRTPTVWTSADCARWSGQSFDDLVGPHADLVAVAGDGQRLVAVGRTFDEDGASGTGGLVLTSTDGRTWRRAELGPAGDLVEGSFTAVEAGHGGWYAASVDIEGSAVWWSPDALRWSVIEASRRAFRGMTIQGLGVSGQRLLVGATTLIDPRPRYVVSRDGGRTWRRTKLNLSMLASADARLGDLSVISGDIVVVGTHREAPVLEGGALYAAD